MNREYGFNKTFESGDSVDADGNAIPWMTYPAIYFLEQLDFSNCDIFEWGSGNSSLYFSKRAKSVRSVESNPEWHKHVQQRAPENVKLSLEASDDYATCIRNESGKFSIIVIDGDIFRRLECAMAAIEKLKHGGIIVLDNSDWLQNTCTALRERGFEQIDFGGPGPINEYTWCTSIFFRNKIQIPSLDARPRHLRAGLTNVRDTAIPRPAAPKPASPVVPVKTTPADIKTESKIASFENSYSDLKTNCLPPHADVFCSQEGEDILIKRLLKSHYHSPGFYVDIGAFDPVRFSNTYHYYLQGWQGINIEPSPGARQKFNRCRPRDTTLELGIAEAESQLEYFRFQEPAFNTFDCAKAKLAEARSQLIQTIPVQVVPLDQVLNLHLAAHQQITFMSIDVEGFELSVLNSSDWQRYRPLIVCIEALGNDELKDVSGFMADVDYIKTGGTKNSHIYCESNFWREVE